MAAYTFKSDFGRSLVMDEAGGFAPASVFDEEQRKLDAIRADYLAKGYDPATVDAEHRRRSELLRKARFDTLSTAAEASAAARGSQAPGPLRGGVDVTSQLNFDENFKAAPAETRLGYAGRSLVQGAGGVLHGLARTAEGMLAGPAGTGEGNIAALERLTGLQRPSDYFRKGLDSIAPGDKYKFDTENWRDESVADFLTDMVPSAVGSAGAFALGGAAGATAKIPAALVSGVLGAASQMGLMDYEAEASGATDAQRALIRLLAVPIGASEALGASPADAIGGKVARSLVSTTLREAGKETAQEFGQTAAEGLAKKGVYDRDRPLGSIFREAAFSGLAGGIAGGGQHLVAEGGDRALKTDPASAKAKQVQATAKVRALERGWLDLQKKRAAAVQDIDPGIERDADTPPEIAVRQSPEQLAAERAKLAARTDEELASAYERAVDMLEGATDIGTQQQSRDAIALLEEEITRRLGGEAQPAQQPDPVARKREQLEADYSGWKDREAARELRAVAEASEPADEAAARDALRQILAGMKGSEQVGQELTQLERDEFAKLAALPDNERRAVLESWRKSKDTARIAQWERYAAEHAPGALPAEDGARQTELRMVTDPATGQLAWDKKKGDFVVEPMPQGAGSTGMEVVAQPRYPGNVAGLNEQTERQHAVARDKIRARLMAEEEIARLESEGVAQANAEVADRRATDAKTKADVEWAQRRAEAARSRAAARDGADMAREGAVEAQDAASRVADRLLADPPVPMASLKLIAETSEDPVVRAGAKLAIDRYNGVNSVRKAEAQAPDGSLATATREEQDEAAVAAAKEAADKAGVDSGIPAPAPPDSTPKLPGPQPLTAEDIDETARKQGGETRASLRDPVTLRLPPATTAWIRDSVNKAMKGLADVFFVETVAVDPVAGAKSLAEHAALPKNAGREVPKEAAASLTITPEGRLIFQFSLFNNPGDAPRLLRKEVFHAFWRLDITMPDGSKLLSDKDKRIMLAGFGSEEGASEFWGDNYDSLQGPVGKIFRKLRNFLTRLGNALRGNGFTRDSDIFDVFESLELALSGEGTKVALPGKGDGEVRYGGTESRHVYAPDSEPFNEADYRPTVVNWAKKRWGDKVAPNGKPVWQNFVRWFGDSKVVDENGEPLVVYHGTGADKPFTVFREHGSGGRFKNAQVPHDGMWFSEIGGPGGSGKYVGGMEQPSREMPVFVVLKNPLIVSEDDFARDGYAAVPDVYDAVKLGHDGIVVMKPGGTAGIHGGRDFAVSDPTRIKSAIGNNGNFDENEGDIRYSLRPPDKGEMERHAIDSLEEAVTKAAPGTVEALVGGLTALSAMGPVGKRIREFYDKTGPWRAANRAGLAHQAMEEAADSIAWEKLPLLSVHGVFDKVRGADERSRVLSVIMLLIGRVDLDAEVADAQAIINTVRSLPAAKMSEAARNAAIKHQTDRIKFATAVKETLGGNPATDFWQVRKMKAGEKFTARMGWRGLAREAVFTGYRTASAAEEKARLQRAFDSMLEARKAGKDVAEAASRMDAALGLPNGPTLEFLESTEAPDLKGLLAVTGVTIEPRQLAKFRYKSEKSGEFSDREVPLGYFEDTVLVGAWSENPNAPEKIRRLAPLVKAWRQNADAMEGSLKPPTEKHAHLGNAREALGDRMAGHISQHAPHYASPEAFTQLSEGKGPLYEGRRASIAAQLIASGLSEADATQLASVSLDSAGRDRNPGGALKLGALSKRAGSLEFSRSGALDILMRDHSKGVLRRYFHDGQLRIDEFYEFAETDGKQVGGRRVITKTPEKALEDLIQAEVDKGVVSKGHAEVAREVLRKIRGTEALTRDQRIWNRRFRGVAGVAVPLGVFIDPVTIVGQHLQFIASGFGVNPHTSVMFAMRLAKEGVSGKLAGKSASGRPMHKTAVEAGVAEHPSLGERDLHSDPGSLAYGKQASEAVENLVHLSGIAYRGGDVFSRVVSAFSSLHQATRLAAFLGNPKDHTLLNAVLSAGERTPKAAKSMLTDWFGVSDKDIAYFREHGKWSVEAEQKIMNIGAARVNFRGNSADWAGIVGGREPSALFLRIMGSFHFAQTRSFLRFPVKQAMKGNAAPMIRALIGAGVSKPAVMAVVAALGFYFGHDREEPWLYKKGTERLIHMTLDSIMDASIVGKVADPLSYWALAKARDAASAAGSAGVALAERGELTPAMEQSIANGLKRNVDIVMVLDRIFNGKEHANAVEWKRMQSAWFLYRDERDKKSKVTKFITGKSRLLDIKGAFSGEVNNYVSELLAGDPAAAVLAGEKLVSELREDKLKKGEPLTVEEARQEARRLIRGEAGPTTDEDRAAFKAWLADRRGPELAQKWGDMHDAFLKAVDAQFPTAERQRSTSFDDGLGSDPY